VIELRLFAPKRGHLRPGITGNHRSNKVRSSQAEGEEGIYQIAILSKFPNEGGKVSHGAAESAEEKRFSLYDLRGSV
jgi:hypothetical protein